MKVLTISVTEQGRAIADRLPYEVAHGRLADTVRARWADVDGLVLVVAVGAAVRVVGPLLSEKRGDPAVVCIDDAGRFAVALLGGHAAHANDLAREVAAHLGATPVVTTATDSRQMPSMDELPGFAVEGDVAAVTRALLDGERLTIDNPRNWPIPDLLSDTDAATRADPGANPSSVVITDLGVEPAARQVILRPPSLILGIGASSGAPERELAQLIESVLAAHGLSAASVAEVATIDRKATEAAIVALPWPLRSFASERLASFAVPHPSAVVAAVVGTPSVAEAAALAAAGAGAELVVAKHKSAHATVAVARRAAPKGHLSVVGLGPGGIEHRTAAATTAVRRAEILIGYGPYLEQCLDAVRPGTTVVPSPIGAETVRVRLALHETAAGRRVVLVSSGDAGIYAMASLVFELAAEVPAIDPADIAVIPGVTAAVAAAALLGAPLGHDHAAISLSDLLTPWSVIERRLSAAAEADLVVTLYNPRSNGRHWQLGVALGILSAHRKPQTPVGVVTDAGRPGQRVELATLGTLDPSTVTMTTCVIVGASSTRMIGTRMFTPRGYGP